MVKFTAKITLTGSHVLTNEAVAGLVGQQPVVRCGRAPARGTVTAAELVGRVLTLTIDTEPGAVTYAERASMSASMGYVVADRTVDSDRVNTVGLLEVLPAEPEEVRPAEPPPPPRERHLLDHLRFAIADPGAFGKRLPITVDEPETIANWGARACIIVIHERDFLARTLTCSQCGKFLRALACGPTHALAAFDPWQHPAAPKPKWDRL